MSTVRRSVLFSFLDSYLGVILSLASYMVLARLLKPAEVGLFAVASAMLGITAVIRDFGLVSYLIQKKELDQSHIATAWGLALLMGGTLFAGIQLFAGPLGTFYGNAELTAVARVLSLNFLLLPFTSVCLALLRRDMQFQSVMTFNLVANVGATLTTIGLAWLGAGVQALVVGSVGNSVLMALCLLRHPVARALTRPRLTHWRELVRFGGPLTVANVTTSAAMDINDLAVGKFMSFDAVALLSRAQGIMNLFHRDFMAAVRNVAYPAFANAYRNGASVEASFVTSVGNVTAVAWTFYGFAALFPLDLLRLMFGPQWDLSAPLVPWFCLAGAISATTSLVPTAMLACGHARLVATAELGIQPARMICLCLVCYLARSLEAQAIAAVLIAAAAVPYFFLFKQRCLPTAFAPLARELRRNLLLTLIALAPALVISSTRSNGAVLPVGTFLLAAAATGLAWLIALRLLHHPLQQELTGLLRNRFRTT